MDGAAYVFCVQTCKSGMTDWMELPSSSGVQVGEEPAGTHEKMISLQESHCLPLDVEMINC